MRGGFRQPEGVAAEGARVAWSQPRCSGGQEIVVQSSPEPTSVLAACRAEVLTRSAQVRGNRIVVRVRCPIGCSGLVLGVPFDPRSFAFGPGTHRLGLRVLDRRRRTTKALLELSVDNGPVRSVALRLRR